jgi:hypothetical protein
MALPKKRYVVRLCNGSYPGMFPAYARAAITKMLYSWRGLRTEEELWVTGQSRVFVLGKKWRLPATSRNGLISTVV